MALIPLTQEQFAEVNDSDLDRISLFKWCAVLVSPGKTYAQAYVDGRNTYLHRFITDAAEGLVVDHVDGNGLNNQRANLRVCTHAENIRNRKGKQVNNTSGFVGVVWFKSRNKWVAQIKHNQRNIFCGYFTDPVEAAIARDRRAIELQGEFAFLNFPQLAK